MEIMLCMISALKRLRKSGGASIGHEIDLAFTQERRPRRLVYE